MLLFSGPAFSASIHHVTLPQSGTSQAQRAAGPLGLAASAPNVVFESGALAVYDMGAVTNAVFDWGMLQGCHPVSNVAFCATPQTITLPTGPDVMSVTVTTPQGFGQVSSNGFTTNYEVDLKFSTPVAGVGMNVTAGYRFGWTTGFEAFDVNGVSLGKIEQSGYDLLQPATTFDAALVSSGDLISSIRIYNPGEAFACPGCFTAGQIQIHEAPEPSALLLSASGMALLSFGMIIARIRRRNRF
jgi:hypothetical protein